MTSKSLPLCGLIFIAAATSSPARAQALDPALLAGTWRLTANYDEFEDGQRRETWGAHPVGLVQFGTDGIFTALLMAADRAPRPGTVPTEPVGPALAYYGTFEVDTARRTFSTRVQQSTWPQWNGARLTRTVVELTATKLKVVSDPIRDPQGRMFQPHLEFARTE